MTNDRSVDRSLEAWLRAGPSTLRDDVVETALTRTRLTRQRGRLALAVVGPAAWPPRSIDLPALGRVRWVPVMPVLRSVSLLLILAVLLALLAVFAAGIFRPAPAPNWPPFGANGTIAYTVSDMETRPYNHFHFVEPDGSNDREIAQGTAVQFSVDGTSLVYFSGWGYGSDDVRLVIANADATSPRAFSFYQQTGFAVSPDGTRVVLRLADAPRDVRPEVSLVNLVDGSDRVLLPAPPSSQRYSNYAWSPDGKYVAYSVLQEVSSGDNFGMYGVAIELIEVASGERQTLTTRPATDSTMFVWSPDSQRLMFTATPDGVAPPSLGPVGTPQASFNPPQDIFVVRVDGSGELNITNSPGFYSSLGWAPDGSAVSYMRTEVPVSPQITVLPMRGGEPDGAPISGPVADSVVWSPDATRLLLVTGREGGSHIDLVDRYFKDSPQRIVESVHLLGSVSWQRRDP